MIAIDSLYPMRDHTGTIAALKNILRRGGQIALFCTHLSEASGEGTWAGAVVGRTRLAPARKAALRKSREGTTNISRPGGSRLRHPGERRGFSRPN